MVDYTQLIINALFTGIGSASGLYAFERYFKPRLVHVEKKVKKIKSKFKSNV